MMLLLKCSCSGTGCIFDPLNPKSLPLRIAVMVGCKHVVGSGIQPNSIGLKWHSIASFM